MRLGFVPLTDCAPLVVAQELGFFARQGVEVTLRCELGWATVRDKLLFGELDAAHALAPMLFLLSLGLGGSECACATPLIISAQGNAITVSQRLWDAGVHNADGLRKWRNDRHPSDRLTFGIVFPYSSHHLLLRDWLASAGLDIARDIQLVVVPPPQMVSNLKAGHLDGFCAGEPWNTVAIETGAGCCVARSATLDPLHPEKVLLIRQELLDLRRDECLALTSALLEACAYCANPENTDAVADLLAQPRYLGISRKAILESLRASGAPNGTRGRHLLFYGPEINDPTTDKAGVFARRLRQAGLLPQPPQPAQLSALFRSDLFQTVVQENPHIARHETKSENQIAFATN